MARQRLWLAGIILAAISSSASGQDRPGPYLGASFGSHGERSDRLEGTAPAAAVVGGYRFTSSWSLEAEFGRPTRDFVRERTCRCFSFATSAADFDRLAVTEQLREERDVRSTLSIGAVYQPHLGGPWSPRLFLGATRHRVREAESSTIVAVPEGVDPVRAAAARPASSFMRSLGGPSLGGGVSYRATPHLAVGADVRYDFGSIGDEINNVWRTSVRSVWSF